LVAALTGFLLLTQEITITLQQDSDAPRYYITEKFHDKQGLLATASNAIQ